MMDPGVVIERAQLRDSCRDLSNGIKQWVDVQHQKMPLPERENTTPTKLFLDVRLFSSISFVSVLNQF